MEHKILPRMTESGLPLAIDGVYFSPRSTVHTPGGPVLHLLKGRPLARLAAGEIYFSEVLPGHIKAWKRHKLQTQNFSVPRGRLLLAIYDDRMGSPSRGALLHLALGRPDAWGILRIPPGLWYGFTAAGTDAALICNCADRPHDLSEGERLPVDHPHMPDFFTNLRMP